MINVYILTFCRNPQLFYGTELIFKTLRVGFPNARVTIADNASLPDMRSKIESRARENECAFVQIPSPGIKHHEFLYNTIRSEALDPGRSGALVFLDPDICLWESCEDFAFDGLMAGKISGKYWESITDTVVMPRIHTSHLWIPDVGALWREIWRIKARRFDFEPFLPYSFNMDGAWYRYDTGSSIFNALAGNVSGFTEGHRNCYDHLYAGSHLDWIFDYYDDECKEMMSRIHQYAREGDLTALRGVWKYQEEVFVGSISKGPFDNRRDGNGNRQERSRREGSVRRT